MSFIKFIAFGIAFCCLLTTTDAQDTLRVYYGDGKLEAIGILKDKVRNGDWIHYHPSGTVASEGKYYGVYEDPENGNLIYLKTGNWTYYHDNGKIKSAGAYEQNQPIKEWRFYSTTGQLTQVGNYEQGKQYGEWKQYDETTGKALESIHYLQGKKATLVQKYYKNKTLKQTGWATNDFIEGKWSYYHQNGQLKEEGNYMGTLFNPINFELISLKSGEWKTYYDDGKLQSKGFYSGAAINKVTGEYTYQKVGLWENYYPNGVLESKGKYKEGKRHGNWQFFMSNYRPKSTIYYINGKTAELVKATYPDGTLKSIGHAQGIERAGEWKTYHPNGKIQSTGSYKGTARNANNYVIPLPVGEWTMYHDNGKIKSTGHYIAGKRNGTWIDYYPSGKTQQMGEYINGEPSGGSIKTFYESGQVQSVVSSDFGFSTMQKNYYENGQLQSEGSLDWDNKKEGNWVYYYENGQKEKEGSYESGQPLSDWQQFDEKGKKIK